MNFPSRAAGLLGHVIFHLILGADILVRRTPYLTNINSKAWTFVEAGLILLNCFTFLLSSSGSRPILAQILQWLL